MIYFDDMLICFRWMIVSLDATPMTNTSAASIIEAIKRVLFPTTTLSSVVDIGVQEDDTRRFLSIFF